MHHIEPPPEAEPSTGPAPASPRFTVRDRVAFFNKKADDMQGTERSREAEMGERKWREEEMENRRRREADAEEGRRREPKIEERGRRDAEVNGRKREAEMEGRRKYLPGRPGLIAGVELVSDVCVCVCVCYTCQVYY